jgi:hypothetical protein
MKKLISSAIILFAIVILQSCSTSNQVSNGSFVQKRKYNKGWHTNLNFHKNNSQNTQSSVAENNPQLTTQPNTNFSNQFTQDFNVNIKDTLVAEILNHQPQEIKTTETPNTNCDKIYLKNGEEVEASIIEITDDVVKYKKCNNDNGPLFTKNLETVVMIIFKDGSKQIIEQKALQKNKINQTDNETKETEPAAINSLIFGILSLLLWPLGIVSIILGNKAKKNIEKNNKNGIEMAKWGIWLGVVALVWGFLLIIALSAE